MTPRPPPRPTFVVGGPYNVSSSILHPTGGDDLLARLLEETAAAATAQGLMEAEIDAELAVYNTERQN